MIDEEQLIQENINNLEASDIPIVSYFGSGSSLLGNILIKLGLDYIEGYQEKILPGSNKTETINPLWRKHWSILDEKYENLENNKTRFFKAHHYPVSFKKSKISKAVLLVRDGRDAILSYYNWRKGFLNDQMPFDEFLMTDSFFKRKPFHDWALFCKEWNEWGEIEDKDLHIVTFEQLKFNGVEAMKGILDFSNIPYSDEKLNQSVADSSLKSMQRLEDTNADNKQKSRIFRKGLIGEWRTIYTQDQLDLIPLQAINWLERLGYSSRDKKIPKYDLTIITSIENEKEIQNLLGSKNFSSNIITTELFKPSDLEDGLGKIVISNFDNNEIMRSIDCVCEIYSLSNEVIFSKNSLQEIRKKLDGFKS